jgi:protease-4
MKCGWIRALVCAVVLAGFLAVAAGGATAADNPGAGVYSRADFMFTSGGALWWESYGLANPALLTYVASPDLSFTWRGSESKAGAAGGAGDSDLDLWGIFAAVPHLGLDAVHEESPVGSITDYRLGFAMGSRKTSAGVSYGWSRGDTEAFDRVSTVGLGLLARPAPYLSVGLAGQAATEGDAKEGVFDLGLRPLGTDRLTVFGDYALEQDQAFKDGAWSTGAAVRVLPGGYVTARYFDTHALSVGLSLDLGRLGFATQAHYDGNQHRAYNTYRVRAGAYSPNIVDKHILPERKYLEFDLFGPVKYQRYRWFDDSWTLAGLLANIEAARSDPRIAGIAINTSGMEVNREVAWEVREKLREFKAAGKRVVIYIDGADINHYHFASIADRLVLDPLGIITFEGYVMGRTFLKGTLAKLGLGFDEWRFFTYKSANEALSRDSMSEADREQRQRLVDEYYALAKTEICAGRGLSAQAFDDIVNNHPILLGEDALAKGLVDTLARWDAVEDIVKSLEGKSKSLVEPASLALGSPRHSYGSPEGYALADTWGELPRIAVVYALGECAMDTGIKARTLSKDIDELVEDSSIEAIVLRVDSPGGDALASDIVAEALKKAKDKKPVIVTQGAVAASGGYWLSMYGDKIVAAPQTITGSIGVIGGWFYNAGLKEKLGMTTDRVQVGNHADLGFGMIMPLLGAGVPDRNLTEWERSLAEGLIRTGYKEFLTKVAAGRGMKYEDVDRIGQGRVWPGVDGKANGLVDELGGLETAILLAKQSAGIPADQPVTLVEAPKPDPFNTSIFSPKLIGLRALLAAWLSRDSDSAGGRAAQGAIEAAAGGLDSGILDHLRFRLEHNGEPMPMLPFDDMDMALDAQMPKGH